MNDSCINIGKILHLDGDPKYGNKARNYYRKAGLNAIVKNVSESRQPYVVRDLIRKYTPNMLVITGHDSMIKKSRDYYNINNYKNSKYFKETILRARECIPSFDELIIFAGACESFYEVLINAGANFASSPARIKIDFMDPLIVAEKIITTPKNKYITIDKILPYIRDGAKGVGGTRGRGQKNCL